jgi:ABC-type glycerol-3-phosphate transport system permease component
MKAGNKASRGAKRGLVTLVLVAALLVFLLPLVYGLVMSVKTEDQVSSTAQAILPKSPSTFVYQGKTLELFEVPISGQTQILAALDKTRASTTFVDPANPSEIGRAHV